MYISQRIEGQSWQKVKVDRRTTTFCEFRCSLSFFNRRWVSAALGFSIIFRNTAWKYNCFETAFRISKCCLNCSANDIVTIHTCWCICCFPVSCTVASCTQNTHWQNGTFIYFHHKINIQHIVTVSPFCIRSFRSGTVFQKRVALICHRTSGPKSRLTRISAWKFFIRLEFIIWMSQIFFGTIEQCVDEIFIFCTLFSHA